MDPQTAKGQMYAGHFDDDFFHASFASTIFKGSSGQTTNARLGLFLKRIVQGEFADPDLSKHMQEHQRTAIEGFLNGTIIERSKPTILLDEPDKSLDVVSQVLLWNGLRKFSDKIQIIVTAHSLLACDIEGANYITLGNPKYLEDCRKIKTCTNLAEAMAYIQNANT